MDVAVRRLASRLAILFLVFPLINCGGGEDEKFVSANSTCFPAVAPGRFILHNQDGSLELVSAASKEEVIDKFIRPRGESLRFVTHDFIVKEEAPSNLNVIPKAIPDNWGIDAIHAPALWSKNIYGAGVMVAVIDSGVDTTHPSLSPNIYSNPGESGSDMMGNNRAHNGIDDDDNGFIDDAHGFNFAEEIPGVVDETGHGTHVAGIIAAHHNDTVVQSGYVQGVAPKVKVLPIDFMKNGSGYIFDGLTGIKYARDMGAKIINASWGGMSCLPEMATIVADLVNAGVLFVSAAGNENMNIDFSPTYPAALKAPSQITVGAIGWGGFKADFSNYGDSAVNIFAPGVGIVSTVPMGAEVFSGTSMASPFVAGAAALIWSANPTADVLSVRDLLLNSVTVVPSYRNSTRGRLDLEKSRQLLGL